MHMITSEDSLRKYITAELVVLWELQATVCILLINIKPRIRRVSTHMTGQMANCPFPLRNTIQLCKSVGGVCTILSPLRLSNGNLWVSRNISLFPSQINTRLFPNLKNNRSLCVRFLFCDGFTMISDQNRDQLNLKDTF